ncbi:MAG: hypothetical protein H7222_10435 [Methylotenera sp.]|nr:hypothetical protein [Oligoflexia bacterium]
MSFRLNLGITLTLVGLLVLNHFITPYMSLAAISYSLLVAGLIFRKDRKVHPILMSCGIAMDLTIVLALQIQRDAVQTAMKFSLSALQQLHIACSSVATALYIPVVVLGILLLRSAQPDPKSPSRPELKMKRQVWRFWHLRLAVTAFIFRSLGFLLMFSMLEKRT